MLALIRPVPQALVHCQLTYVERTPIDLERARRQHAAYEAALAALGCEIRQVPAADHLPDCVFVEDTAVVLDEVAVITRPGAITRADEIAGVAAALSPFRDLQWIGAPGTLDGGDVLRLGRTLYVGLGGRSSREGADQLQAAVGAFGYEVRTVEARGCLHLKSAATELGPGRVLVNPQWIDPGIFAGLDAVEVDPAEPFAANVLRLGDTVLCAEAFPRTRRRIEAAGLATRAVDMSELAKAEGAVTCCSVVFQEAGSR